MKAMVHFNCPDPKVFAVLLEFAKAHHEVCEECEGSGRIYNNADPTSGQWVECPFKAAIAEAEREKI